MIHLIVIEENFWKMKNWTFQSLIRYLDMSVSTLNKDKTFSF